VWAVVHSARGDVVRTKKGRTACGRGEVVTTDNHFESALRPRDIHVSSGEAALY